MVRGILIFCGLMMGLLLVMDGCARKSTTSTVTTEVSDSTHVRETPRTIFVNTPGDTVVLEKLIECDSATNKPKPFRIHKKSERASLILDLDKHGKLTAPCVCDSLQQVVKAMDKEIFRLRTEKGNSLIAKEVPVTMGIDKFCRWFTLIAILAIVAFVFYKLNQLLP